MNHFCGIGRLTRDPEIRVSQSDDKQTYYGSYSIAIQRSRKNKDGEYESDFFECSVVGKTAEFAEKYLRKGMKVGITGELKQDRWTDKDGNSRSTVKIQVLTHDFCEKQGDGAGFNPNAGGEVAGGYDGFMNIPDGIEEELPFT